MGVKTSTLVVDRLKAEAREKKIGDPKQVKQMLKDILIDMMKDTDLRFPSPTVLMVIGVNGVGKTTTIGKLAVRFQYIGRKVIICAGDTFRAAAADQLEIWAERANTTIIRQHEGADPAAVLFDAIQASRARKADVLIVDTAGRLHNKTHLMERTQEDGPASSRASGPRPNSARCWSSTPPPAKTASNRRACSRTSPSSTA